MVVYDSFLYHYRSVTWLALALAGSLASFRIEAQEGPEPWLVAFQEGQRLLDEGLSKAALKAFKEAAGKAQDECPPCLVGIASSYTDMGKSLQAETASRRVLEITEEPGRSCQR